MGTCYARSSATAGGYRAIPPVEIIGLPGPLQGAMSRSICSAVNCRRVDCIACHISDHRLVSAAL